MPAENSDTDRSAPMPLRTMDDTVDFGRRLARRLRPGDVVCLTGQLGAGKTTLARGLGQGLSVRGPVTSPTFVIARVHPSLVGGPAMIHVDAYRLDGVAELEDLDLESSLDDSITVLEWGQGLVQALSDNILEVVLDRSDPDGDTRRVHLIGHGPRWAEVGQSAASD